VAKSFVSALLAQCSDPEVGATLVDLLGSDLGRNDLARLGFEVSPSWAHAARRGDVRFLVEAAASSPSSPEVLAELAKDPRLRVRRLVAGNEHASAETLESLYRWGCARDEATARAAFANRSLPAASCWELFRWSREESTSATVVDDSQLLWRAAEDIEVFTEVFEFLASHVSGFVPMKRVQILPLKMPQECGVKPSFLDLFPGGRLETLLCVEDRDAALLNVLDAHGSPVSAPVLEVLLSHGFEVSGRPQRSLTADACRIAFGLSDLFRLWAVSSRECPQDLLLEVFKGSKPSAHEMSLAFDRVASLDRPSELLSLLASLDRSNIVNAEGRLRYSTVASTLQRQARRVVEHDVAAPRPRLAVQMCRFGAIATTALLLEHLGPDEILELIEDPGTAFWDVISGFSGPASPERVADLVRHSGPSAEFLFLHVPGMPRKWASSPGTVGWHSSSVSRFLSAELGSDAEAWRFAVSLIESWEGSFVELAEVAASAASSPGSSSTPSSDSLDGSDRATCGDASVLPLVFDD
jgi:hypothetical protein